MNHEEISRQIDRFIEEHREEMIRELMDWVRIPSVSRADLYQNGAPYGPDVRKMLDHALKRCRDFGFRTADHEGYCGSAWYGDSADEIGFYAHLDVVPEGPNWIYEPYEPVVKDGYVIGRGADDNKAAGVLGLYIMRFLQENNIQLKHAFRLMLGCAEETGMDDFRTFLLRGGRVPEFGIVADAGFPVCYAQKGGWNADLLVPKGRDIIDFRAGSVRNAVPGSAELVIRAEEEAVRAALSGAEDFEVFPQDKDTVRIVAKGRGGHAAFPSGTDNAATKLAAVFKALPGCDLRGLDFIAHVFRDPYGAGMGFSCEDEVSGKLTSNAGVFSVSGDFIRVLVDVRYPVSAEIDEMTDAFKNQLASCGVTMEALQIERPFYIDPEDGKVRALQACYRAVTGRMDEPYAMGGGTYSRVIPGAISFGPGSAHQLPEFLPEGHGSAHGPDEVLHIESWLQAFRIYVLSILRLSGADDSTL